jgi:hypothetical protein
VKAQHFRVVHLVYVVARQNDDVLWALLHDRVHVLVHGISGALIPVLADAFLRRKNLDELSELLRHDAPAHADVAIQRERLVLRRDEDAMQPGVDAVAQGEIDDAVRPAEKYGRFRAVARQRVQALTCTACEQNDQRVVDHA